MNDRKIYATIDGGPAQWLLVRNRVNPVQVGNAITVRSYAAWVEPVQWVQVRVVAVSEENGFITIHTSNKTSH